MGELSNSATLIPLSSGGLGRAAATDKVAACQIPTEVARQRPRIPTEWVGLSRLGRARAAPDCCCCGCGLLLVSATSVDMCFRKYSYQLRIKFEYFQLI